MGGTISGEGYINRIVLFARGDGFGGIHASYSTGTIQKFEVPAFKTEDHTAIFIQMDNGFNRITQTVSNNKMTNIAFFLDDVMIFRYKELTEGVLETVASTDRALVNTFTVARKEQFIDKLSDLRGNMMPSTQAPVKPVVIDAELNFFQKNRALMWFLGVLALLGLAYAIGKYTRRNQQQIIEIYGRPQPAGVTVVNR